MQTTRHVTHARLGERADTVKHRPTPPSAEPPAGSDYRRPPNRTVGAPGTTPRAGLRVCGASSPNDAATLFIGDHARPPTRRAGAHRTPPIPLHAVMVVGLIVPGHLSAEWVAAISAGARPCSISGRLTVRQTGAFQPRSTMSKSAPVG